MLCRAPVRPRAVLGAMFASASFGAFALDLRVTTTADEYDGKCTSSHCSLRDAITVTNATSGGARILLGAGTYDLSLANPVDTDVEMVEENDNLLGDLDVTGTVKVVGASADTTIIAGNRIDRIFDVRPGGDLTLQKVTLSGGKTPYFGGGLLNHGQALLQQVVIASNQASSGFADGSGAGIGNFGTLQVYHARIADNDAGGGEGAYGSGAGIYNGEGGTLLLRDSLVSGNHCHDDNDFGQGCGLYNEGSADVARTTFTENSTEVIGQGAAIKNNRNGYLKLTNSTLSGNTTGEYGGGALQNGESWYASSYRPKADLISVTIAGNAAYGVVNFGELSVRNSIIAGNVEESLGDVNCRNDGESATFRAVGLLLGTGAGNCVGSATVQNGDTFSRQLFPLADNNGYLVHALRRGSLAIDSGVGSCTASDERGASRPRDGDGDGLAVCDLGAFERYAP